MAKHLKPFAHFCIDFIGGILLPLLCLVFDPFVFQTNSLCTYPLFDRRIQIVFYSVVGMCITALAIWLIFGRWFTQHLTFLAGIFWVGVGLSAIIGLPVVLLEIPLLLLSLFALLALNWPLLAGACLLMLVALLPLLTISVFFRNARAAWIQANPSERPMRRLLGMLAGILFVGCAVGALYQPLNRWLPMLPPRMACPAPESTNAD